MAVSGLMLLALPAEAGAARVYAGWLDTPGWDNAMVARTASRGTPVRSMVLGFPVSCRDGSLYVFHADVGVVRSGSSQRGVLVPSRNRGGRFAAVYRGRGLIGDYIVAGKLAISGTFRRRAASGRLRLTSDVIDPQTNERLTTCGSTRLTWKLRRHPRWIYGGATSQGEPVAVFLSKDRSKVREIGIGWHSGCSDSSFIDIPDAFTNFAIRAGKFGDTWGFTDRETSADFEYHLKGQITRRAAHGAFEVDAFLPDGRSCRTGELTWTTRTG